jgi:2-methylfumaryl-CoA isomerase
VSVAQWKKLVEATETGAAMDALEAETGLDFTREEDRYAAREAISAHIARWCSHHNLADIRRTFDHHNVCWGPYQTFEQMVRNDPRASVKNPLFAEVEQPGIGTYPVPGVPGTFSAVTREPARRAPRVGEHTDEILAEVLGLDSSAIGKLHDQGVVA